MKEGEARFLVVDPGESQPVIDFAKKHHLKLSDILITHHHHDHIGGVPALAKNFHNVNVTGPNDERITSLTTVVKEDDNVYIPYFDLNFKVIETPGHTRSHICFWEPTQQLLFSGDTLFSAGCGRLFEGSAQDMHHSLAKLSKLPGMTKVYCAHEYTRDNLRFAQSIEPSNQVATNKLNDLKPLQLSLPSTIQEELAINPFLRVSAPEIKAHFSKQHPNLDDIERFALIRQLKDIFQ